MARYAALLWVLAASIAVALFLPTLSLSYSYDDIDFLNLSADVLAGKRGLWGVVFRPHYEHLLPMVRLAMWANAALFGVAALPYRLGVLALHATSGWLLGLVARRLTGQPVAGVAAVLAYVLPVGFSSMAIWFPSGVGATLGMTGICAALLTLSCRASLGARRARLLAGAGAVWALLSVGLLAPLLLAPMALDERERRREGGRGPVGAFSIFCALLVVAAFGAAWLVFHRTYRAFDLGLDVRHGLPRAAFLALVAPFHYFFPGIGIPAREVGAETAVVGSLLGLVVALPVAALLVALWRRGAPSRLLEAAAASAVGGFAILLLIGLRRSRATYLELYDADRYFSFLLMPLALLAAAAAAAAAERLRSWPGGARRALACLVLAALVPAALLHRQAFLERVPFAVYAAHGNRFEQLESLALHLAATAERLPPATPRLTFPDADFWYTDVHNGRLSARLLFHLLGAADAPRLRLGGRRVGERDARVLNQALAAWSRQLGEPRPTHAVVDGELTDTRILSRVDFASGPFPEAALEGFHAWEGAGRWMGEGAALRLVLRSGALELRLAAPMDQLRQSHPPIAALSVQVAVRDESTAYLRHLGAVRVTSDGIRSYRLDASPFTRVMGNGRAVQLDLRCEPAWRPADRFPGSLDRRTLCVQVFAAGSPREAPR